MIVQASLNDRYERAAAAVKADTGLDAFIAPAGLAWQKVYDDMNTPAAGIPIGTSQMDTNALQHFEAVQQSALCAFLAAPTNACELSGMTRVCV